MTIESNIRALVAFEEFRTPSRVRNALFDPDPELLRNVWRGMSVDIRESVLKESEELHLKGIYAVNAGDRDFPHSLIVNSKPIVPTLFCLGDRGLLTTAGAGMCGSRRASPLGLKAAHACGEEVSQRGLTVISGYAKGVDTATHLAALDNGGKTVIVLAEGINGFRIKKDFTEKFDPNRVLVVSQFRPSQPWAAYAAMARNHVIFGLGKSLVVIEAGDKGGTLAAGKDALKRGRPVLALNFGKDTPAGNKILIETGAKPINSRIELGVALDNVKGDPEQGVLL